MAESPLSFSLGIDVGSTTVKTVLTKDGKTVYEKYQRHFSKVRQTTLDMLCEMRDIIGDSKFTAALSGSAGL